MSYIASRRNDMGSKCTPWAVKGNRIEGPDGETVAYVTEHETLTPRQQANARRIADAPKMRCALQSVLRYLADLNGCAWIPGDSPGELDMRQRAKGLQERLANLLREE